MSRLVVFERHHLGDAIMALPFLRAARDRYRTSVVCRPSVAALLRAAIPDIEILEEADSWGAAGRLARSLRLGKSDSAACVWADARAHLLMAWSGAGIRAGFPMTPANYYAPEIPWRRRRLWAGSLLAAVAERVRREPLLTNPIDRACGSQHHMEDWRQLAMALGFVPDDSAPWLALDAAPPAEVANFVAAQEGRKILLLHPGGRLPTKRWPYFSDLLARLARQDIPVLILHPPGEAVPDPCGPLQKVIRVPDWPGIFATFQAVDAVVCNDSLASHLAAAVGKPVVAVFGSGNPDWFAPWNNAHLVAAADACKFRPCIDRCVMPAVICLDATGVELVESRVHAALGR